MLTTDPATPATSPPRPRRRPARLGPDHQPRRRSRRGIVADHARRRALPRLLVRDRRHQHGPRPSAGRGRDRRAGRRSSSTASRTSCTTSPACGCTTGSSACCPAGRGRRSCPTRAPRPSRRRSSWRGSRPAGRPSWRSATATTGGPPRRWPSRPPRTSIGPPSNRCPGSVYHTAYPYCYRAVRRRRTAPDACTCDWEAQLDLTFHQFIYPDQVAAIIIEPILGEGGYVVPPPGFLPRLREITRQHGILLIADEVQTGFGRTGELFAVQHWDVEPDILVMAKGIASGLPLSGILARQELMTHWKPGHPRRHVRRQRRVVRGRQRHARRDRGRGARRQRPRARCPVPGRPAGTGGALPVDRRCARPGPDGRDRAREARRRRRPRRRIRT